MGGPPGLGLSLSLWWTPRPVCVSRQEAPNRMQSSGRSPDTANNGPMVPMRSRRPDESDAIPWPSGCRVRQRVRSGRTHATMVAVVWHRHSDVRTVPLLHAFSGEFTRTLAIAPGKTRLPRALPPRAGRLSRGYADGRLEKRPRRGQATSIPSPTSDARRAPPRNNLDIVTDAAVQGLGITVAPTLAVGKLLLSGDLVRVSATTPSSPRRSSRSIVGASSQPRCARSSTSWPRRCPTRPPGTASSGGGCRASET